MIFIIVRIVATVFPFALSAAFEVAQAQTTPKPEAKFTIGQEWTLKSTVVTSAKIIIGGIEGSGENEVIHISLVDVPLPATVSGSPKTVSIGHMPFTQAAMANSVEELIAVGAKPASDYKAGYSQWKQANGGVYSITVDKALDGLLQNLTKRN